MAKPQTGKLRLLSIESGMKQAYYNIVMIRVRRRDPELQAKWVSAFARVMLKNFGKGYTVPSLGKDLLTSGAGPQDG